MLHDAGDCRQSGRKSLWVRYMPHLDVDEPVAAIRDKSMAV
jgi:hypothetical protein